MTILALETSCDETAIAVLRDGKADREDLNATFVAICRAAKIPARMVWSVDFCYAEFYLEESPAAAEENARCEVTMVSRGLQPANVGQPDSIDVRQRHPRVPMRFGGIVRRTGSVAGPAVAGRRGLD